MERFTSDAIFLLREKLLERFPSLTAAFLALDRSGRGRLSIDAFAIAAHSYLPGLSLEPGQLADLLRAYDQNGNGTVTFQEFSAAMDGLAPAGRTSAASLTPPRTPRGNMRAAGKPRGALAHPLEVLRERATAAGAPLSPPPRPATARLAPAEPPAAGKPSPPRLPSEVAPAPALQPVRVLAAALALCRFPAASMLPQWATSAPFFSATRAGDELSLLVPDGSVPHAGLPYGVRVERGWRALRVGDAPLGFELVGVLAGVAAALASARVPILAISTFDHDYVCVREAHVRAATHALSSVGYDVSMELA